MSAAGRLHLEAMAILLYLVDPLAIADFELMLFDDIRPEGEEVLFQDLGEFDLADQRQFGRLRHHQLAAGEMRDRSAETVLLHSQVAHFMRLGGQAGGDSRRSAAHDQHIENALLAGPAELADRVHRLPALLRGIAYEAHAPKLARDEKARDVGFECLADVRDIHPAGFRAENQRNGVVGAGGAAGAVADALGPVDKLRLASHKPDNVAFRGMRLCTSRSPCTCHNRKLDEAKPVHASPALSHVFSHQAARLGAVPPACVDEPDNQEGAAYRRIAK